MWIHYSLSQPANFKKSLELIIHNKFLPQPTDGKFILMNLNIAMINDLSYQKNQFCDLFRSQLNDVRHEKVQPVEIFCWILRGNCRTRSNDQLRISQLQLMMKLFMENTWFSFKCCVSKKQLPFNCDYIRLIKVSLFKILHKFFQTETKSEQHTEHETGNITGNRMKTNKELNRKISCNKRME